MDDDLNLKEGLGELPAPATPPALGARVQGRVQRQKVLRRVAAAGCLALVAVTVGWLQWPREPARIPIAANDPPTLGLAVKALAGGPPVAQLDVLAEQQSAVWASLTDWTEQP